MGNIRATNLVSCQEDPWLSTKQNNRGEIQEWRRILQKNPKNWIKTLTISKVLNKFKRFFGGWVECEEYQCLWSESMFME